MNTFYQMWGVRTPEEAMKEISRQRSAISRQLNGREPQNLEEQALLLVGEDIYEKLIKGYTEKQWGRPCTELPAFIIRRLPLRYVFDNNYFNDPYQGIPMEGYNALIEKLLDGVETRVNCDFFAHREELESLAEKIVYTGPIDQFYDFRFGPLQYRTVRFETEVMDTPNHQGNAVINYTDRETPFTRIIEHKHFESFGQAVYENPKTVISREYSTEWQPGMEPYYPVNDERNAALYAQYKELADKETKVFFGGRLAEYKYYDMAPTIEQALRLADEQLRK
jgi:UDP-galactopyranose mutase